jgi:hypothetical protein
VTGGTLGNSFADAERGSDERGVLHGAPAGNNAIGAATAGGIRDRPAVQAQGVDSETSSCRAS